MCGTGTGKGRAEGCVLAHWPPWARRPRCPDGAPGEGAEGRASPARFWAAAGALAALPGERRGEPAVTGRRGGRLPPALSFALCPQFCELPCQLTDLRALVPTGGTILGSVCPRCGGEEGRSAAWQGFVLPRREQGNQTETFEGS